MNRLLNHSHRELIGSTAEEDRSNWRWWRLNTNVNDLAPRDSSCNWDHWILSFRFLPVPAEEAIVQVLPLSAVKTETPEAETWQKDMLELFASFRLPSVKRLEFYQRIKIQAVAEAELRMQRGKFVVEVEVSYAPTNLAVQIGPSRRLVVPGLSKDLISSLLEHQRRDSHMLNVVHNCSVCMKDIAGDMEPIRMPCEHVFCCQCIARWLERSNTCPVCRCIYEDIAPLQTQTCLEVIPRFS